MSPQEMIVIRKGDNIKTEIKIKSLENSLPDKMQKLIAESRILNRPFIVVKFIKDQKTRSSYTLEKVSEKRIQITFPIEIFNFGNFPATNIEIKTITFDSTHIVETFPQFNFYFEKSIDVYPNNPVRNKIKIIFTTENQRENFEQLTRHWMGLLLIYCIHR